MGVSAGCSTKGSAFHELNCFAIIVLSVLPTVILFSLMQSLGQVGRVVKVFPTGDVRVVVNSRTWTYNPRCLKHAPLEDIPPNECVCENICREDE